ncbi:5785_t:CDS:2 [Acaulospora colombiana]|uniref:5785_t:CDS:1 n=1 Tax=Acaulospora colombiana TaxID=27376 RepID=A0ACA9KT74_9GLOM|nr:5785_t:CDS:2 [Acaulospora colombiana]
MSDEGDDTSNYDQLISSKEWERMSENFGNAKGKDITIQRGFDRGYAEGAVVGKEIGRLRGILNTLQEFYSPLIDVDDEDIKDISRLPDESTLDRIKHLENKLACLTFDKLFANDHFQLTLTSEESLSDPQEVADANAVTHETCSCQDVSQCECGSSCEERKHEGPEYSERSTYSSSRNSDIENSAFQTLKEYREEIDQILSELGFTV